VDPYVPGGATWHAHTPANAALGEGTVGQEERAGE
jgi:hypothetical protein